MAALAILFVGFQEVGKICGHAILQLQSTYDLAALKCVTHIAELTRSDPRDSWIGACVCPSPLTFRAGYLERVVATTTAYSHSFEFPSL